VFGFKRPVKGETNARFGNTADDDEDAPKATAPVNPNRLIKPTEKMVKVKNMNDVEGSADPEAGMNRKERYVVLFCEC